MLDSQTEIRIPHEVRKTRKDGKTAKQIIDGRISVAIHEEAATLTLFFPPGALGGDNELLEIRLTPSTEGSFEPWQLVPSIPVYATYSRAALARRGGDTAAAVRALRTVGTTRRGLSADFLKLVAQTYVSLVEQDVKYPIKTLASLHNVDKSTASRWVTAARRGGYLEEETR